MVGIAIDSVVAPVLHVRAGLVGEGDMERQRGMTEKRDE